MTDYHIDLSSDDNGLRLAPRRPPAALVALIGADCPACNGTGSTRPGLDYTGDPCPDCIDGKQTVTVETRSLLGELAERGYVTVHPDDVPESSPAGEPGKLHHSPDYSNGWNDCRRHIFDEREATP